MHRKTFFLIVASAVLLLLTGAAASAQVGELHGHVVMKGADGNSTPVEGAAIDVFRTDISGTYKTKTNKKGDFIFAGLPYVGTYVIAASAPGARPDFIQNVKAGRDQDYELVLGTGDGKRLTMDDIKKAATGSTSSAPSSGGKEGGSDKARREEMNRKKAEFDEKNKKIVETNTALNTALKAGNAALLAKNYDEAIKQYEAGIAADADQPVFYQYKAIALYKRAIDKYNAAAKSGDAPSREAARNDFKAAVEASEKAVSVFRSEQTKASTAGNTATPNPTQSPAAALGYLSTRFETYRLAADTSTQVDADAASKAMQEYAAAETDPVKKAKAEAAIGQSLFQAGNVEKAVSTLRQTLSTNPDNVDAMYWLGLALSSDKPAEARDMLQKFVAKVPDTDPRKKEAAEAVKALDETLKPAPAATKTTRRRG
jgi:tetratricopeptide (TPR) repeat protein